MYVYINHKQTTIVQESMMYEVKVYKQGQERHHRSFLFEMYKSAMTFIHSFQEEHGKNWVIELIQEG